MKFYKAWLVLALTPLATLADREAEINRDFGLMPPKVDIRHVPEEGVETILNAGNEPVSVSLVPGVERRLVFPQAVLVGVPNDMVDALVVQNIDRSVFMTALTPIPHARVLVRHTDNSPNLCLEHQHRGRTRAPHGAED